MQEEEIRELRHCEWGWGSPGTPACGGPGLTPPQCLLGGGGGCLGLTPPPCPQVTLLSFSVESEFTFVDYIRGG